MMVCLKKSEICYENENQPILNSFKNMFFLVSLVSTTKAIRFKCVLRIRKTCCDVKPSAFTSQHLFLILFSVTNHHNTCNLHTETNPCHLHHTFAWSSVLFHNILLWSTCLTLAITHYKQTHALRPGRTSRRTLALSWEYTFLLHIKSPKQCWGFDLF